MAVSRSSVSKQVTKPPDKRKKKKKKKAKLGSGKRFKDVSKSIQKSSGKSKEAADAIAASIGRKKYGKKKFAALSAKGRKRRA